MTSRNSKPVMFSGVDLKVGRKVTLNFKASDFHKSRPARDVSQGRSPAMRHSQAFAHFHYHLTIPDHLI